MADLLIKDIEMPKNGSITVTVYSDMVWCDLKSNEHHGKVKMVPPHGRLVDAGDVMNRLALKPCYDAMSTLLSIQAAIDESETVLEATNG